MTTFTISDREGICTGDLYYVCSCGAILNNDHEAQQHEITHASNGDEVVYERDVIEANLAAYWASDEGKAETARIEASYEEYFDNRVAGYPNLTEDERALL